MRSCEKQVSAKSDYYVYAPGVLAQKVYLYPLSTGHFYYEPGYQLNRSSFDSFLLMYLIHGSCRLTSGGQQFTAKAGQFVLLDCYQPHGYGSPDSWEASWLHFDGRLARDYYEEITSHHGHVLLPDSRDQLASSLNEIFQCFRNAASIRESAISSSITTLLNGLLVPESSHTRSAFHATAIADCIAYMNEHFHQPLNLDTLAEQACISRFHFTRVFTKETGFTPHQYLIRIRLSAAKYMLKSTQTSMKEIAYSTGFSSESGFCTTFKKWEKKTPGEYREEI